MIIQYNLTKPIFLLTSCFLMLDFINFNNSNFQLKLMKLKHLKHTDTLDQ